MRADTRRLSHGGGRVDLEEFARSKESADLHDRADVRLLEVHEAVADFPNLGQVRRIEHVDLSRTGTENWPVPRSHVKALSDRAPVRDEIQRCVESLIERLPSARSMARRGQIVFNAGQFESTRSGFADYAGDGESAKKLRVRVNRMIPADLEAMALPPRAPHERRRDRDWSSRTGRWSRADDHRSRLLNLVCDDPAGAAVNAPEAAARHPGARRCDRGHRQGIGGPRYRAE